MRTLIIVDDHPRVRAQLRALLEAGGFTVLGEAADAASAVRAVEDLDPDVVVVDIGLPDRDGIDVARRLAATDQRARIVLTSSRPAEAYGPRLRAAPAVGFVTKDALTAEAITALLDPIP